MCNCIKQEQERLTKFYGRNMETPKGEFPFAHVLPSKEETIFIPFKVTSNDLQHTKTVNILPKFCPFCGSKIKHL